MALVDPKPEDLILDPACGSGGFLIEVLKHKWEGLDERARDYNWSDLALAEERTATAIKTIFALEVDEFLVGKGAEAEELRNLCGDVVEFRRLRLMRLLVIGEEGVEREIRALLEAQLREERVVLRSREADRHSARLVVREDDDERLVQHTTLFQVTDQRGDRLIDVAALQSQVTRQIIVLVPASLIELDTSNPALGHAPGEQAIRSKATRLA